MNAAPIPTDPAGAPPARAPGSALRRRALVLAGFAALAIAWMWHEQAAPAQPGRSLLPVDADIVLAASIVMMIVVEAVTRLVRRRRIDASDSVNSMTIGLGYFAIGAVFGKIVA